MLHFKPIKHRGYLPSDLTLEEFVFCQHPVFVDDWLTVHRSITLVNFQLDAQNSLFIYI